MKGVAQQYMSTRGSSIPRDSRLAQRDVLLRRIIPPNAGCEFGRRHGFDRVHSIGDFQQAVPMRSYEDLRPDIERMLAGERAVLVSEPVRRFFITSGSSAKPKFVPVTNSFIRDKWRAFQQYWGMVRRDHPGVFQGVPVVNFSDGSREQTTAGGALCSSESSFWNAWGGREYMRQHPLPSAVLNIANTDARYYTIARILLEMDVSLLMALNPSTILCLFDALDRNSDCLQQDIKRGGLAPVIHVECDVQRYVIEHFRSNTNRAAEIGLAMADRGMADVAARLWPKLRVIVCWRSPMVRPYLDRLDRYLAGVPQRDYITMASEGVIAIPFEDGVNGGALATETHFYEFIPEQMANRSSPPTLLPHELECGCNYAVVLTTSAGLYRYSIGDVVRVKGFQGNTPVVEFLYRVGNSCSLTGEKLTEDQVASAVAAIASRFAINVHAFTMCPVSTPFPHYALLAEIHTPPDAAVLRRFLAGFDHQLGCNNVEYRSKRTSGRLAAPELWLVAQGSYTALRERRTAANISDTQVKISCLTRDAKWPEQFEILEHILCESLA